jgi:hypothetical protein
MKSFFYILFLIITGATLSGCTALFGDKKDKQTDDIFVQGSIDPRLNPTQVGYVPVFPYFTDFSHPVDVFVGYDELIYVVDDNGLNILDQKGTRYTTIPIPGATDVTQDRKLHTYVAGKVFHNGVMLAAIYHLMNTGTGNYQIIDTLIHPYCDDSRAIDAYTLRQGGLDEQVSFTGLATMADNTLYVSRTGPVNVVGVSTRPDNSILVYDDNGNNLGNANGLSPNSSSLRSCVGVTSLATLAAPPQKQVGMPTGKSFVITQFTPNISLEYKTLYITVYDDPDLGTQYTETPLFLNFDYTKANRFIYEIGRFGKPEDCFITPDNLQYLFVVDSQKDSLYVFNNQGQEGITPPPGYPSKKQVIVSFGGPGSDGTYSGPFSFNDPSGVCYNRRIVYVADKNNNRICRFKLSSDLQ